MGRRDVVTFVRDRDLAFAYGGIVAVTCLVLSLTPAPVTDALVQDSSTNLANLRQHPFYVLIVSAFIEPSASELWLVALLVWAVGASQRWLGRASTVIAMAMTHIGATLLVATVLSAGIAHGEIGRSVAHAPDVGVSYVLVGIAGVLSARVTRRWAKGYAAALTIYFLVRLLTEQTFTELGHLSAWSIGIALAIIIQQARRERAC